MGLKLSTGERFERFPKAYLGSDKTAYARGMQIALRECYGIDDISSPEGFTSFWNDYSKYCRFAYPLPDFHNIHSAGDICKVSGFENRPEDIASA